MELKRSALIVAGLMAGSLLVGFLLLRPGNNYHFVDGYEYTMPRPKTEVLPFDLSDREVRREMFENEASKKEQQNMSNQQQAKAAQKKAKAKEQKKKQAEKQRKKKFEVSVIEADQAAAFEGERTNPRRYAFTQSRLQRNQAAKDIATDPAIQNEKEKEAEKERLSLAEWRALFDKEPTLAMAARFSKARSQQLVTNEDYYTLTFELFRDEQAEKSKIGTHLLSADNSASAFEFIAKGFPGVSQAKQQVLWDILINFAFPTKIASLQNGLESTDPLVVQMATQVMAVWVRSYKELQNRGNQGQEPVNAATSSSIIERFLSLIPTLQRIASSQDSNANLAQLLVTDLQGLTKTGDRVSLSEP